jgi:hypothetical protein
MCYFLAGQVLVCALASSTFPRAFMFEERFLFFGSLVLLYLW